MAATLYELLEVRPNTTTDEITAAYYRQRAKLAADSQGDDRAKAEANRLLDEAYQTLSDPAARATYDRRLGLEPPDAGRALVPMPPLLQPTTLADVAPGLARADNVCGNCGTLNPATVTVCVLCGVQIGRPCPLCGHVVYLAQAVCSHCATPVHEYDRRRFDEGRAVEQQVQTTRRAARTYNRALRQANRADAISTVAFRLLAGGGGLLIILIAYLALQYFRGAF